MEFDSYADLDSPVHSWEPVYKLPAGFALILTCASLNAPWALAAAGLGALALMALARLPLAFVLRMLKGPVVLLALMLPLLVLTAGGQALWSWRYLSVSRSGMILAGRIAVKSLTVFLLFLGFFGSVRLARSLQTLETLKVPPALLAILLFTYRYIFLYLEDMRKLLTAARLRGYNLHRGVRHIVSSSAILVTLLLRSYEQSERAAAAMRLRGFDGSFHGFGRIRRSQMDFLAVALTAVWIGLLIWLELR
jgi:cobalt/nickel transport system permease protein